MYSMNLVMNYIGLIIMNNMQVIAEGTNWDMTEIKKKARVNIKGKPGKSRRGIISIFADMITTEKVSTRLRVSASPVVAWRTMSDTGSPRTTKETLYLQHCKTLWREIFVSRPRRLALSSPRTK